MISETASTQLMFVLEEMMMLGLFRRKIFYHHTKQHNNL